MKAAPLARSADPQFPEILGFFPPSPHPPWAGLLWRWGQLQVPAWRIKNEGGKKQEEHQKHILNCNCQILHQQKQTRPAADKKCWNPQTKITRCDFSAAPEDSDFQIISHPLNKIQTKPCLVPHCLIISQAIEFQILSWGGIKPNKWGINKTNQTGSYCSSSEWQCNTQMDSFSLD